MLLLVAAALLLAGLWIRSPTISYDGPATPEMYSSFALERFAYSDIAMTYFRDGLAGHPRPYFDYQLEYPVGTGLLIYLLNAATHTMPQYFLLTSLAMTICALCIAVLVPRFPRGSLPLFALTPALALYVNLNWDMWSILFMVASLLLFVRERDGWGAAVLAAAVWTKFFPIVFLPFLLLDRLQHQGWRASAKMVAVFVLASAAINAPVLLPHPEAWWYFFEFNATRNSEMNLWAFFYWWQLSTAQINLLSTMLLMIGFVALVVLQARTLRRTRGRRLPAGGSAQRCPTWLFAGATALAWFFFVNKVYSPQYGLWIVALLAVVGATPVLVVAWSAVDLTFFAAHFVYFGLIWYGDAARWFEEHGFLPATALREGMLLVVVGWCIKRMRALPCESAQDRGER